MIKYRLFCKDCEIIFDSWFASSNEYEKLKKNKFLNCHNCSSRKIEKTLMAPKLISTKDNSKNNFESKKYEIIKKTINKYQKFIKNNFEYVGENFAYEARSIHYENKKKTKGIYGNASQKDLKELSEEGIDIQTIPWVENKDN
tara:strand:- start:3434 stop:3862 length:429 start_codon:yes stop_codon:yes gene_type:complete